MARPKKGEEQSKDAGTLLISREEFVRTRDSVSDVYRLSVIMLRGLSEAITTSRSSSSMRSNSSRSYVSEIASAPSNACVSPRNHAQGTTYHHLVLQCPRNRMAASIQNVQGLVAPGRANPTFIPKVVTGLATLQSAVQDLSRAYITHTNTVLGKGTGSSVELPFFTNPLGGEIGLFGGRTQTPVAAAPEQSAKAEGKKRKRAPHDKNAPKRPRTPYFLYMQFARDGISRDMGPGFTSKQVQDEGTRRWNSMGKGEKEVSFYTVSECSVNDR